MGVRRGGEWGTPRVLALPPGVGWSAEQGAQEAEQVWGEDESPVLGRLSLRFLGDSHGAT